MPPRTRTRGFPWLLTLNLLLFIALASVIGYGVWIGRSILQPVDEVDVPNLVGKSQSEAETMAKQLGFKLVVVDTQYRDKPPAGVIYQMREVPGSRIKEGKPIAIWVSLGPEMVEVPDVTNVAQEKAQRLLEKASLKLGEVSGEYDPITPRGNVLKQMPYPAEKRPRGAAVDLVVSKGEEPLPTPEPTPTPGPEPSEETVAASTPRSFLVPKKPYIIPNDGVEHRIRIDLMDDTGDHIAYEQTHRAGDRVQQEVTGVGARITIRLYDNDVLKGDVTK